MEWISPAMTALGVIAAFFAGNGLSRLRLTGRLRETIAAEQLILDRLDKTGPAHTELTAHLNQRVQLLIAEQTPYTPKEHKDRRAGLTLIALGLSALSGVPLQAVGSTLNDATTPIAILLLLGFPLLGYGTHLIARAADERNKRREDARKAAQPVPGGLLPPWSHG